MGRPDRIIRMTQTDSNTWHGDVMPGGVRWVIDRRLQRKGPPVWIAQDLHGEWKVRVNSLDEAVKALGEKAHAKVIMPKNLAARVVERFVTRS